MDNSPYLDQPLRSPDQVMDSLRAKHSDMLARIHAALNEAETLAQKIANEHSGAPSRSFDELAEAIGELRADYLAPADHDLKEWHKTWEPYGQ